MSLHDFPYGAGAVVFPMEDQQFHNLRDELIRASRPANVLEQILVDQMIHAQWELERVRRHSGAVEAEEQLHATAARARRNWMRAWRELTALQSARASQELNGVHNAPPLANTARIPAKKPVRMSIFTQEVE